MQFFSPPAHNLECNEGSWSESFGWAWAWDALGPGKEAGGLSEAEVGPGFNQKPGPSMFGPELKDVGCQPLPTTV